MTTRGKGTESAARETRIIEAAAAMAKLRIVHSIEFFEDHGANSQNRRRTAFHPSANRRHVGDLSFDRSAKLFNYEARSFRCDSALSWAGMFVITNGGESIKCES